MAQTGCAGDFLDRYTVDLTQETVTRTGEVRDTSPSTCNANFPEVMGAPDLLGLSLPQACESKLGPSSRIAFFTFGNSDLWRGRLALGHAPQGNNWEIVKDRFLLYPLCNGDGGPCEKLGVAGTAALDMGAHYYLYPNLFANPSSKIGILLLRVSKRCQPPFVAFEPGGTQIFDTVTDTWVDLDFDPVRAYEVTSGSTAMRLAAPGRISG